MKVTFGKPIVFGALLGCAVASNADVNVTVDAEKGVKPVSPYIFGRNIDGISDTDENVSADEQAVIDQMNEAGLHFLRANNGNNSSRYNWRKKLTVHPDWYNNVNAHDWDITAKKILDKMPDVVGEYAFQLSGYAASTTEYNFADWDFYVNHDNTWAKSTLDLAGGGEVSEDGQTLIKAGDYSLYNEVWPADSTVGIIAHWRDELKYDMSRFLYWSMDNEMEIWGGTHSDLPLDSGGAFLVRQYVDVAKKARAAFPDIKLMGPVAANEWQWCNISGGVPGKKCWLEYFIEQVAAEQKSSGMRLLDVFDIHWYPGEKTFADMMNWHRVFFDTTYNYPGANGIKTMNGSWDNSLTKEFIFKRISDWLDKYFGENHGITLALTETDLSTSGNAMTTALVYASFIGTFMDNGVEVFTPWVYADGMYETLHLFSRYGHEYRIESFSDLDSLVSAYSTINQKGDSLTVIFVNRSATDSEKVNLKLENFKAADGSVSTLTLSELSGETFKSHSDNALKSGTVDVASNALSISLAAKSITAVLFTTTEPKTAIPAKSDIAVKLVYGADGLWFVDNSRGKVSEVLVLNAFGQCVEKISGIANGQMKLSTEDLPRGSYLVRVRTAFGMQDAQILVR